MHLLYPIGVYISKQLIRRKPPETVEDARRHVLPFSTYLVLPLDITNSLYSIDLRISARVK